MSGDTDKLYRDFQKVMDIVYSCKTQEQLNIARRVCLRFLETHSNYQAHHMISTNFMIQRSLIRHNLV